MHRLFLLVLIAAGFVPGPGPAFAGDVTGVVLREPAQAKARPTINRYRGRDAVEPAGTGASEAGCECNPGDYAVVHLRGENLPPLDLTPAPPSMAQKNRTFEPAVIAIPAGGEVLFPNEDPFFHNVFSYAKTRSFDLGKYPKGESHAVTFEKPGIVPVFCEIHYSMRAYIHVFDTPYFAVSDLTRRFEIPDVAPGDYTLHVWQENLPEITVPVTVGPEPVEVEVR